MFLFWVRELQKLPTLILKKMLKPKCRQYYIKTVFCQYVWVSGMEWGKRVNWQYWRKILTWKCTDLNSGYLNLFEESTDPCFYSTAVLCWNILQCQIRKRNEQQRNWHIDKVCVSQHAMTTFKKHIMGSPQTHTSVSFGCKARSLRY